MKINNNQSRIRNICIVFLFFSGLAVNAELKGSTKSVNVEIELEEIPIVGHYEIEVKKTSDKSDNLLSFKQKESFFKIKLKVGNYLMRTRMITKQAEIGPWSDWSELLARPEEVHLLEPPTYKLSLRKNQNITDLNLKWQKASGADQYIVWVENLTNKETLQKKTNTDNIRLSLKAGDYKIGVQSVSKDGIRSAIKYFDDNFGFFHAQLPLISVERKDLNNFSWRLQKESGVKIDVYRKAFFAEKFVKIESFQISGENFVLPKNLQPGEYRIDFQYVSEAFLNGPVQSVSYLKKPTEKDFTYKF